MDEKTKTLNQVTAQSPDSAMAKEHGSGNFLSTERKSKEEEEEKKGKICSPNKQTLGIEKNLLSLLFFKSISA